MTETINRTGVVLVNIKKSDKTIDKLCVQTVKLKVLIDGIADQIDVGMTGRYGAIERVLRQMVNFFFADDEDFKFDGTDALALVLERFSKERQLAKN